MVMIMKLAIISLLAALSHFPLTVAAFDDDGASIPTRNSIGKKVQVNQDALEVLKTFISNGADTGNDKNGVTSLAGRMEDGGVIYDGSSSNNLRHLRRPRKNDPPPAESCASGVAALSGWSNWFGDIQTNSPVFRVKTDNELRTILEKSRQMVSEDGTPTCKVRITGATQSEDGMVMQQAEPNIVVVSLVDHIPDDSGWAPSADATTGLVRLPAGFSWYQATELYRPQGLVLRERTAGRFFSVGGVIANPVHGGSKKGGFMHSDVTGMLVMLSDGSVSEVNGEDLEYWRSSGGHLGIILAVEMKLVKEVEKGSLKMGQSNHDFSGFLQSSPPTLDPPTPQQVGTFIQAVTSQVFTTIASTDHAEFFFDIYSNTLAEYSSTFDENIEFTPELAAQYAAYSKIYTEQFGQDAAFTGAQKIVFPDDLCEFLCVPPSGPLPIGDGTSCIRIPSQLEPGKLLCESPLEVSAALNQLTVEVANVSYEAAGNTINDGYTAEQAIEYKVTSLIIPARAFAQIFAAWWQVTSIVIASSLGLSDTPDLGFKYFPSGPLEWRFINPEETAIMNPIMTYGEWKAEFNDKYFDSFDALFPPLGPEELDGLISIEVIVYKGVNDDDVDKYLALLEKTWANTPSNPLAPYGNNVDSSFGRIVPDCNPSGGIVICTPLNSAEVPPQPPFVNPINSALDCCNPRVPVNVHIAKAWGHGEDPDTTPTTGKFVPFQDEHTSDAIFSSSVKADSIDKFNDKIEALNGGILSGGSLLRWLKPEEASVYEPRKLSGHPCGSREYVSNPDAECLSGQCNLRKLTCEGEGTADPPFRVAIDELFASGCSEAYKILGGAVPDGLPLSLYYPTEIQTAAKGGIQVPGGRITIPTVEDNTAEVADGLFPLIVYSHGYTGAPFEAISHFTALASQGYIVVSIGHVGSNEFDYKTIGREIAGSDDYDAIGEAVKHFREPELNCGLDFLLANPIQDSKLAAIKSDAIGFMGFSLGGFGVIDSRMDNRVKAIVPLSPAVQGFGSEVVHIKTPTLIMYSADDTTIDATDIDAFWNRATFGKQAFKIFFTQGEHNVFSDVCLVVQILDFYVKGAGCPDSTNPVCGVISQFKPALDAKAGIVCAAENIETTNTIRKLTIGYAKLFFDGILKPPNNDATEFKRRAKAIAKAKDKTRAKDKSKAKATLTEGYVEMSSDGLATLEKK